MERVCGLSQERDGLCGLTQFLIVLFGCIIVVSHLNVNVLSFNSLHRRLLTRMVFPILVELGERPPDIVDE